MITPDERAYFYSYTRRLFKGYGDIVDLGSWLGATTISLTAGLLANPRPTTAQRVVHAYDRFIWEDWMTGVSLLGNPPLTRTYRSQDSFIEEFHERVAPWKHRIVVHQADLLAERWPKEQPIELLLVDAMKSWDLTNSILRHFFPSLVPGRSVVIHQDFAFWGEPWVHLVSYRLRRYLKPVYHVPGSSSMVFELRKTIPEDLLYTLYSYDSFSLQEIDAAITYSASLVSPSMRAEVLAVKILIHVHRGDLARARYVLDMYRAHGVPITSGMRVVAQHVSSGSRNHDVS